MLPLPTRHMCLVETGKLGWHHKLTNKKGLNIMERVPDIVANVFTESGIQIGTLTVDEHQKIMKSALKKKSNYVKQAKNAVAVFLKAFFITLKGFVLIAAIIFSLFLIFNEGDYKDIDNFIFNKNAALSSIGVGSYEEGFLFLFSMLFLAIISLKVSFQCAFFASLLSVFDCVCSVVSLSSKKKLEIYTTKDKRDNLKKISNGEFEFAFKNVNFLEFVGQKNIFQLDIDTEIKKALQEQSDCKIVVKYQESN